jgi:apolipoprotein D and lipocalin family protein
MRIWVLLLSSAFALAAEGAQELKTVPAFDLDRYMGRWYEVARLPNRFQDDCAGNVTATYAKQPDGGMVSATGAARQAGAAKLKVRFAPAWLSWLPMVWGDYWVIDLADDYSWAVVGEPSREYFWILSRTPEMEEGVFQGIVGRAERQGYDLAGLVRMKQD